MSADDTPLTFSQGLEYLEAEVARIRVEWPEFSPGEPYFRSEESLLDELVLFASQYPDIEAQKNSVIKFSATGISFLAVWIKSKAALSAVAAVIIAFCRSRKCSIAIKVKGQTITAEAPTIEEVERMLRVANELFIHPAGRKK